LAVLSTFNPARTLVPWRRIWSQVKR